MRTSLGGCYSAHHIVCWASGIVEMLLEGSDQGLGDGQGIHQKLALLNVNSVRHHVPDCLGSSEQLLG